MDQRAAAEKKSTFASRSMKDDWKVRYAEACGRRRNGYKMEAIMSFSKQLLQCHPIYFLILRRLLLILQTTTPRSPTQAILLLLLVVVVRTEAQNIPFGEF